MRVRNFQAIKGRIIIILAVVGFLMVSFCLEPIKTYLFAAEASGKKGNWLYTKKSSVNPVVVIFSWMFFYHNI